LSDDILIPKRYRSITDEQRMAWPSIRQPYCGVCGKPTQSNHHIVFKSQGGHDGPTIAADGIGNEDPTTCHGAAHHHDLHYRYDELHHVYYWIASERYAPIIERRRRRAGIRGRIQPGIEYVYHVYDENADAPSPHADFTDADGDLIAAMLDTLDACAESEAEVRWTTARAIAQVVAYCERRLGKKRGSGKAAIELITEQRPELGARLNLSPSNVSRYMTWASVPQEWGAPLGVALGNAAGRALREHDEATVREAAEAVVAGKLRIEDFEAELLGREPIEEKPKCVCDKCGALHNKKEGRA